MARLKPDIAGDAGSSEYPGISNVSEEAQRIRLSEAVILPTLLA
jgi:hypothetical protein